jgi:hypothetical protein
MSGEGIDVSFDMAEWMTGRMGWSAEYMGHRLANVCKNQTQKL